MIIFNISAGLTPRFAAPHTHTYPTHFFAFTSESSWRSARVSIADLSLCGEGWGGNRDLHLMSYILCRQSPTSPCRWAAGPHAQTFVMSCLRPPRNPYRREMVPHPADGVEVSLCRGRLKEV